MGVITSVDVAVVALLGALARSLTAATRSEMLVIFPRPLVLAPEGSWRQTPLTTTDWYLKENLHRPFVVFKFP